LQEELQEKLQEELQEKLPRSLRGGTTRQQSFRVFTRRNY
jgi:hypothetical protein